MAHSLDLELTGEGVETAAQIAFLQAQGCNWLQGYYYSQPLPQAAVSALLRSERKKRSAGA
jgi:EAL domain-containing protein (putative c-di-GMP-specific phosphodiesterase class I)